MIVILISYLSLKFAQNSTYFSSVIFSPFFAVLFHSLVSNFSLIYCDLKFSLYKSSKCKIMTMAGLKQSLCSTIFYTQIISDTQIYYTFTSMPFGILHVHKYAVWYTTRSQVCRLVNYTFTSMPFGKLHIQKYAVW